MQEKNKKEKIQKNTKTIDKTIKKQIKIEAEMYRDRSWRINTKDGFYNQW